jgi:transcriptional regulator with XRE-family HTH domain
LEDLLRRSEMARRAARPRSVLVYYKDLPYRLDLIRCRRALVERQIEGQLVSMEGLASVVGISRSTASRFFTGRPTSLAITLRILDALHLKFEDVARLEDDPEESEGPPGVGALLRRAVQGRPTRELSLRLDGGFAQ